MDFHFTVIFEWNYQSLASMSMKTCVEVAKHRWVLLFTCSYHIRSKISILEILIMAFPLFFFYFWLPCIAFLVQRPAHIFVLSPSRHITCLLYTCSLICNLSFPIHWYVTHEIVAPSPMVRNKYFEYISEREEKLRNLVMFVWKRIVHGTHNWTR
jgi:hypothetical protein